MDNDGVLRMVVLRIEVPLGVVRVSEGDSVRRAALGLAKAPLPLLKTPASS
jgi:hypothetical protein